MAVLLLDSACRLAGEIGRGRRGDVERARSARQRREGGKEKGGETRNERNRDEEEEVAAPPS